jgi:hypothetical protein
VFVWTSRLLVLCATMGLIGLCTRLSLLLTAGLFFYHFFLDQFLYFNHFYLNYSNNHYLKTV